MIARPIRSGICGTTALPSTRILSTRQGTPSAAPPTPGSACQWDAPGPSPVPPGSNAPAGAHGSGSRPAPHPCCRTPAPSPRDAGCPGPPARANSTAGACPSAPWWPASPVPPAISAAGGPWCSAWPTTQTLSRLCGAPTAQAGITNACAAYPSPSRSESTASSPSRTCPATFSHSTQAGRHPCTRRNISGQRWRSSSLPRCFPATLKGWQGYPPHTRPGCSGRSSGSRSLMSSKMGTPGQCFASTDRQYGSHSQNAMVRIPARPRPSEKPPMPEKRSRT